MIEDIIKKIFNNQNDIPKAADNNNLIIENGIIKHQQSGRFSVRINGNYRKLVLINQNNDAYIGYFSGNTSTNTISFTKMYNCILQGDNVTKISVLDSFQNTEMFSSTGKIINKIGCKKSENIYILKRTDNNSLVSKFGKSSNNVFSKPNKIGNLTNPVVLYVNNQFELYKSYFFKDKKVLVPNGQTKNSPRRFDIYDETFNNNLKRLSLNSSQNYFSSIGSSRDNYRNFRNIMNNFDNQKSQTLEINKYQLKSLLDIELVQRDFMEYKIILRH